MIFSFLFSREIVSHMSGLPREAPCFPNADKSTVCTTNNSVMLERIKDLSLVVRPGNKISYRYKICERHVLLACWKLGLSYFNFILTPRTESEFKMVASFQIIFWICLICVRFPLELYFEVKLPYFLYGLYIALVRNLAKVLIPKVTPQR